MSLAIRDTGTVPDEGWCYPGIDGFMVYTRNYQQLHRLIREHYEANGRPVPDEQEVTDYLCRELRIPCYDTQTREPLVNKLTLGIATPSRSCCK